MIFGIFGLKLFPTFGFFAPIGFNEGPGQALSFGKVWEGLGFENAATIGATFATIGFFFFFGLSVELEHCSDNPCIPGSMRVIFNYFESPETLAEAPKNEY
jgi:hypothetical protein